MSRLTEGVQRYRLSNGTTLLVRENHATPLVAVSLAIRGGAWGETDSTCGLSHLLQRLLMKGTEQHAGDALAFALESHGISLAPFTGKDMVGLSMALLSRHFETGLELLEQIAWHPTLPADAMAREQRNIVQEIQRLQDDPLGWSLELCEATMFAGHPYGFPLTGRVATVEHLTVDQLAAWHATVYGRPTETVIAVVGDVPAERVRSRWEARVQGPSGMAEWVPPAPPPLAAGQVEHGNDRQQAAVSLGFAAPALGSPDHAPFDVLNHILAGMGSRLFLELRDRQGLAYVVSSSYDARTLAGAFRTFLATRPEQHVAALQALRHELDRLRQAAPPVDELQRAVEYICGLQAINLQRNTAQAARFATHEAAGVGYEAVDRHVEALLAVTPDDVQRCAQQYLQLESVAIVSPKAPALVQPV